jgi:hypothetical protein
LLAEDQRIEPIRIAGVLLRLAAFVVGVASHSGLPCGLMADHFVGGVSSLGLFLPIAARSDRIPWPAILCPL